MTRLAIAVLFAAVPGWTLQDAQRPERPVHAAAVAYHPGEMLIAFHPRAALAPDIREGSVSTGMDAIDRLNVRYGLRRIRPVAGGRIFVFELDPAVNIGKAAGEYAAQTELVESAGPNFIIPIRPRSSGRPPVRGGPAAVQTDDSPVENPPSIALGGIRTGEFAARAAVAAPSAVFDGGLGRFQPVMASLPLGMGEGPGRERGQKAAGLEALPHKPAVRCTPGVDCPPEEPKPKPQRPRCTPGVDCPSEDRRRPPQPRCTPGVDCPGDGSPGNSRPTPPPPNYRRRPTAPPPSWPTIPHDPGRIHDRSWVGVGYWHLYQDLWGRTMESHGSWNQVQDSRTLRRGGSETQYGASSSYRLSLQSHMVRNRYRLYWRYVGAGCDPYDNARCLDWDVEYRWLFEDMERGQRRDMEVSIKFFQGDKTLLPWETESFHVHFDGSRVWLDKGQTAYHYVVDGPFVDQGRGMAYIELAAGAKIRLAPEQGKVQASLTRKPNGLHLAFTDYRASYYQGTHLELWARIKEDAFGMDPQAYHQPKEAPFRWQVFSAPGRPLTGEFFLPVPPNGKKLYIGEWGFRRIGSAISSDAWMDGEANDARVDH